MIINMNCTFVDNKTIRIGDKVLIASNVQIYTSSHPVLPQERLVPDWMERQTTFFRTYARPIEIENNVWIGGGCILLPGVTIGEYTVYVVYPASGYATSQDIINRAADTIEEELEDRLDYFEQEGKLLEKERLE